MDCKVVVGGGGVTAIVMVIMISDGGGGGNGWMAKNNNDKMGRAFGNAVHFSDLDGFLGNMATTSDLESKGN